MLDAQFTPNANGLTVFVGKRLQPKWSVNRDPFVGADGPAGNDAGSRVMFV